MATKKIVRWPTLLVGVLGMFFAGIIYAWSILKAPLAAEFGWSSSALALNYTLTMCFFCGGGMLSGVLSKRFSPRIPVLIAALLVFSGFSAASRLTGKTIWPLYLSYGLCGGLGIGMTYNAVISTTSAWFPDKRGVCTGALMMGFGASALVLGQLCGRLIDSSFGWRGTYLMLGRLLGVVFLLMLPFVRFPSSEVAQALSARGTALKTTSSGRDFTPGEMLRSPSFPRFFLFNIALAAVGSSVISCCRDLALAFCAQATLAVALVGVLSVCNGLGRILSGFVFDALGCRKTMTLSNLVTIAAPFILLTAVITEAVWLGVIGVCVTGLSCGMAPTITSTFIGAVYGSKHFGINFSIGNTMLVPASFIATGVNAVADATGGYAASMALLVLLSFLSLLLNLSIKLPEGA